MMIFLKNFFQLWLNFLVSLPAKDKNFHKMVAVITQIFQHLKSNQEALQKLRKKNQKQQKLLSNLEDSLVHQYEFLKTLEIYTQKLVRQHQISWKIVEKELKENCHPCPRVLRYVERFVQKSKAKFQGNIEN